MNFSNGKMLSSWSVYANADERRYAIWFQNKGGKAENGGGMGGFKYFVHMIFCLQDEFGVDFQ